VDRLALRQIDSGEFAAALRALHPVVTEIPEGFPVRGRVLLSPVCSGASVNGMGLAVLPPGTDASPTALAEIEVLSTLLAARIEGHHERERASAAMAERRRKQEEVDRLNLNLERSIFRLRRLEQDRDDLTRMIVHDLRTPMTSIKTTLEMLSTGMIGKLSDEETEMVDIASQSSDRLLGMINDLLDISKFEAGELCPETTDVDLVGVAEGAMGALRPLANLEQKTIELVPPECGTHAQADPDLVRRILENLIGNALRFSPPGSVVRIGIAPSADGDMIELAVRDQGEGIPPEYQDRIFQKFVQVEGRRNGKKLGTGLGLTFCRLATDALGGVIRVESELGKGSTFFVALPRVSD
jgi:signal transduction histidine kinase